MGPCPQLSPHGDTDATPPVSCRPLAHLGGCRRHGQHDGDLAALALLPRGAQAGCPHLPRRCPERLCGLVGLRVREHWCGERGGGQSHVDPTQLGDREQGMAMGTASTQHPWVQGADGTPPQGPFSCPTSPLPIPSSPPTGPYTPQTPSHPICTPLQTPPALPYPHLIQSTPPHPVHVPHSPLPH